MLTVALHGKVEDSSLVERHRSGDVTAFEDLVHTYKDAVYGYLCRCRVSSGARDDLTQEVFMRIHRALHRFEKTPEGSLKAWIFTIVSNAVRSHFRHLGVETRALEQALDEENGFVPDGGPSSQAALE